VLSFTSLLSTITKPLSCSITTNLSLGIFVSADTLSNCDCAPLRVAKGLLPVLVP